VPSRGEPRRFDTDRGGADDHRVQLDQALRPVQAVHQPGLDLAVAVPGPQGRAGNAGLGFRLGRRDPGFLVQLLEQLPSREAMLRAENSMAARALRELGVDPDVVAAKIDELDPGTTTDADPEEPRAGWKSGWSTTRCT
jgi:hypothetical protein